MCPLDSYTSMSSLRVPAHPTDLWSDRSLWLSAQLGGDILLLYQEGPQNLHDLYNKQTTLAPCLLHHFETAILSRFKVSFRVGVNMNIQIVLLDE